MKHSLDKCVFGTTPESLTEHIGRNADGNRYFTERQHTTSARKSAPREYFENDDQMFEHT